VEEREHASIIDVAERAGVSPATVSRALRGLPHVSAATRDRVQQAAADLNYVASPAGIGLASGRTRTVGVVVPLATRWFFARVVAAAEGVLRSWNYDVLLYILGDDPGRSRFFERMPLRRRVDAVLVVALPMSADETERLRSLRVPVVVVGTGQPEFPTVRIDDEAGARQAVQHLLNLGHDAITMISALEDDDPGFASAPARRSGFRLARAHVNDPHHVVAGNWGLEGGARAMEAVLASDRLPSAVFAEYDEMAFGAMLTLRRAGLSVPGDISVVGFDGHEMASVVDLTTVSQPVHEQGELAARMLVDGLRDRHLEPVDVVLPTRLVIRGSTAPPPLAGRRARGDGVPTAVAGSRTMRS
jgi:LacI family transcriptional regulator, repressor for deo operon, udp, cdd, tsx, nupC, and nupG